MEKNHQSEVNMRKIYLITVTLCYITAMADAQTWLRYAEVLPIDDNPVVIYADSNRTEVVRSVHPKEFEKIDISVSLRSSSSDMFGDKIWIYDRGLVPEFSGWIEKKYCFRSLTIDSDNHSYIYLKPEIRAPHMRILSDRGLLANVIGYDKEWLKIRFIYNKVIEGWIRVDGVSPAAYESVPETDYFPTFDMMSISKMSKERPLVTKSGKSIYIVDYCGKEIRTLIEELGAPEYTSALLYFGDYPFSGFIDLYSIFDLYRQNELPVKIYEWPDLSVSVFCIRNGKQFEFPTELTRFQSMDYFRDGVGYGDLPLEKWLAGHSGDGGWLVLTWHQNDNSSPNRDAGALKSMKKFSYQESGHSYSAEKEFVNPEFISKFHFDSFAKFYYKTITFGMFVPEEFREMSLSVFAGMTYDDFINIAGAPMSTKDVARSKLCVDSTHIIWPLEDIIPEYENWPLRVCTYEKNEFQLLVWFVYDDDAWKVLYADIAPKEQMIVEF